MDYTTIRIRTQDYYKLKELADSDERPLVYIIGKLIDSATVKPNPTLKKKKTHPSFAALKEIYCEYWQINNRFEYKWNGPVDATALNRLIKNLESRNEKGADIADFFRIIMDKLPEFYKDKSINAINTNLNGILATIKQGNEPGEIANAGKFDYRY